MNGKPELTASGQLDKIELLALLWPGNVRRDERIHERFEIRPPPLCKCIRNLPFVIDTLARKLCADRRQSFIQPRLEALDFFVARMKVVSGSNSVHH